MKVAIAFAALVAVAYAGAPIGYGIAPAYAPAVYADHHVGAQSEQTVRGFGGLSSLSHQAKTVNGAFSTATSYKTKATNNAVYAAAPVAAYAAPAYAPAAYAAPVGVAAAPVLGSHIGYGYTSAGAALLG